MILALAVGGACPIEHANSPSVSDRCVTSQTWDPRIPKARVYFYDVRKCERWEMQCVDSAEVVCRPIMVNLGLWNPLPSDYVPPAMSQYVW